MDNHTLFARLSLQHELPLLYVMVYLPIHVFEVGCFCVVILL